jgi:putative Ca2+/H+ antiporter (TMEM165/GDT1 family)
MNNTRRPRVPTWFDRFNRYRIAAAFLYALFILTMIGMFSGHPVKEWMPVWGTRALFWTGLLVLTVALAMDAYEVYAGKRRVKHLIDKKKSQRKP